MANPTNTTSPTCWKRPNDIMKMHNIKIKKRALQARMDSARPRSNGLQILQDSISSSSNIPSSFSSVKGKSKNIFKTDLSKRFKSFESRPSDCDLDASNDNTMFQLLHQNETSSSMNSSRCSLYESFANFLQESQPEDPVVKKKQTTLPIDWSLKSRVRFFSKTPFMWNKTLKTLEEASGTTGFSRCLNLKSNSSPSLDTGVNAQFHQCCLVWQHPSLPWFNLFPRSGSTKANKINKASSVLLDAAMRDCLHKNWRESFRSLLQLVRSHQCAYFYVCANKFTILFRAAGIGGISEIHAIITPTTSGFRNLLQKDEIVFTMPLRKDSSDKEKKSSPTSAASPPDLGYETQESVPSSTQSDVDDSQDEEEEEEETDEWLQSLGMGAEGIKRLSASQGKKSSAKVNQLDRRPASLVLVEKDEEVQALFNLLLNCQSIITTSGPLAGVPPTLLAPVAFLGATLRPLTTSQKVVNMNGEKFQCVELSGPMLPHSLRDLCTLLEPVQPQFSISCTSVEHTRTFSQLPSPEIPPLTDVFARENLRDCGLKSKTLHALCHSSPMQVLESVKFSEESYGCEN